MISFRYHVVSLLAVLLALAAGIAVGSGPLQRDDAANGEGSADARRLAAAESQVRQLDEILGFSDAYADATAGSVLGGQLDRRAVTLVTLPGASEATAGSATEMVERAGGAVTARVEVGEKLLDVADRQLVAELATQLHDTAGNAVAVPAGASGYERMGLLVAHAVTSNRRQGEPVDKAGDTILAGAATADLVTSQGNIDSRGSLVIVVAGAPYGSADLREGAASITATLVTALDRASDGVVLLGPVSSAADDGLVGGLRADPTAAREVSTVDVGDLVAGAVVGVLALEQESRGQTGHYGSTAAADGAVPGADG